MAETYQDVEDRIERACDAYNSEDNPKISIVAQTFNVPYHRLRARLKGRIARNQQPILGQKLSITQENALCQYIDRLDAVGVGLRRSLLTNAANAILRQNHHNTATPSPTVSGKWPEQFLARHPEYSLVKQKTIDIKRKKAHAIAPLEDWYNRLRQVIESYGILQEDCYNMDETGFQIGVGRGQ